jgi:hypothetical protein
LGRNGNRRWRLAVRRGAKRVDRLTVAVLSILEPETRMIDANCEVWSEALSHRARQLLTASDCIHDPQHSLACTNSNERRCERIVHRRGFESVPRARLFLLEIV